MAPHRRSWGQYDARPEQPHVGARCAVRDTAPTERLADPDLAFPRVRHSLLALFGHPSGHDSPCFSFRRNIWHRNTYKDAGAVQFYGHSISNIVSETHAERFGGSEILCHVDWGAPTSQYHGRLTLCPFPVVISWGQWRNWTVPGSQPQPPGACAVGVGIQPNMQNQWFNNTVKEGLTLMNYNCRLVARLYCIVIAHTPTCIITHA